MSCHLHFPKTLVKVLVGIVVIFGMLGCNLGSAIQERVNPSAEAATPIPVDDVTPETAVSENPDAAPTAAQEAPTAEPTPQTLGQMNLEPQSSSPIPSSGEMKDEASGIEIKMPPKTMGDAVAQLNEFAIDPNWQAAWEGNYTIESPVVSVTTDGLNDSQGRVSLRLQAPSSTSRLVALIDMTYPAILDVAPVDGFLETAVRVGSTTDSGDEGTGTSTLHFVVLTPKDSSSILDRPILAKPNTMGDERDCGADTSYYTGQVFSYCRRSGDSTVQVTFSSGIGFTEAEGDQVADAMAAALKTYSDLGFTAASITSSSPMMVVVRAGTGDPLYRSMNGVIYLPIDAARNLSNGANHEILHEMAHWIQDEEYNMTWAFWSGGRWWMEVAAENMVMLQDPAYIPQNLESYGAITTDDNKLALQQSPNQWPSDFYGHAQLVKLNMCDDTAVCPLSQATFIAAINAGTYPYDDAGAIAKVNKNLDAYAQYLLGVSPPSGNMAMPLAGPVLTGNRYAEYVNIAKKNDNDFRLSLGGYPPQMVQANDTLGQGVDIQASLQKNGVYPLVVSSGLPDGRSPGVPVALIIQPGAPYWYRIGSDAPIFNDGSQELKIQPIHSVMGQRAVRVVAMGKEGGEVFQAKIRPIDLQGVWYFSPDSLTSSNVTCVSDDPEGSGIDEPESLSLLAIVGSMLGHFERDEGGLGLSWVAEPAKYPPEMSELDMTILGAGLLGADDIQVQSAVRISPPSSGKAPGGAPLLALALVGFGPGVFLWRNGRRRSYFSVLTLLAATIFLTGCFGLELWGNVNADYKFTELTYIGGEGVPVFNADSELNAEANPLWQASGTGEYDIDFFFEVTGETTDAEGNTTETKSLTHCTGTASYQVKAFIFKDVILELNN